MLKVHPFILYLFMYIDLTGILLCPNGSLVLISSTDRMLWSLLPWERGVTAVQEQGRSGNRALANIAGSKVPSVERLIKMSSLMSPARLKKPLKPIILVAWAVFSLLPVEHALKWASLHTNKHPPCHDLRIRSSCERRQRRWGRGLALRWSSSPTSPIPPIGIEGSLCGAGLNQLPSAGEESERVSTHWRHCLPLAYGQRLKEQKMEYVWKTQAWKVRMGTGKWVWWGCACFLITGPQRIFFLCVCMCVCACLCVVPLYLT